MFRALYLSMAKSRKTQSVQRGEVALLAEDDLELRPPRHCWRYSSGSKRSTIAVGRRRESVWWVMTTPLPPPTRSGSPGAFSPNSHAVPRYQPR